MLKVYWQRQPDWSAVVMGENAQGPTTIGHDGCGITCLAAISPNLLDPGYRPIDLDPSKMCSALRAGGALDAEGDIDWTRLAGAIPGLQFVERTYCVNPGFNTTIVSPAEALVVARKSADVGVPVMLRVRLGSGAAKEGNHWVLPTLAPGELPVMDPWTGDVVEYRSRYGDPASTICGYARMFGQAVDARDPDKRTVAWKAWGLKQEYLKLAPEIRDAHPALGTYATEIFDDMTK